MRSPSLWWGGGERRRWRCWHCLVDAEALRLRQRGRDCVAHVPLGTVAVAAAVVVAAAAVAAVAAAAAAAAVVVVVAAVAAVAVAAAVALVWSVRCLVRACPAAVAASAVAAAAAAGAGAAPVTLASWSLTVAGPPADASARDPPLYISFGDPEKKRKQRWVSLRNSSARLLWSNDAARQHMFNVEK